MKRLIVCLILSVVIVSNCKKKDEETTTTSGNISSQVVANLAQVSANYSPTSLATASISSVTQQSDPCQGVSDWAICQSNLIREYIKIGKATVDTISTIVDSAGQALGSLADGSTGTSENGKISWSKTDSNNWSVLLRGSGNAPHLYVSIANNVYTLKVDGSVSETNATTEKAEAIVTYTDSGTWDVDVYFSTETCKDADPGAPSKVNIKLSKANGLWSGKSMLYTPRWKKPNTTVTCSTAAGVAELAMYTEFVGNDTSTKANLYLSNVDGIDFVSSPSSYELVDACTNLTAVCNVTGGPASAGLTQAAYGNPFCTTGSGTVPTWNNACTSNATVNSAAFPSAVWIQPSALKTKTVTLPTTL